MKGMTRRLSALLLGALAATLPLSGCGFGGSDRSTGLLYEASGIRPEATALTVDGQTVSAERYLYWLAQACDTIADAYAASGETPDFKALYGTQTLAQTAARQARDTAALYAEIEVWAQRYGCAVTEKDQQAIAGEWETAAADAGGETAYLSQLARLGVDRTFEEALSQDCYLYSQLYTLSRTQGSALCPAQSEVTAWAEEQGLVTVETLDLSTDTLAQGDTAGLTARRATADNLLSMLQKSTDLSADFPALGAKAGGVHATATFTPGDGTLPAAVETAAAALSEGALSGVVETDTGFYLLRRLPVDQEAAGAGWFDAQLSAAAQAAAVETEPAVEKLDVAAFYKKLTAAREKLTDDAGEGASSGATSSGAATSGAASSGAASSGSGKIAKGSVTNLPAGAGQSA